MINERGVLHGRVSAGKADASSHGVRGGRRELLMPCRGSRGARAGASSSNRVGFKGVHLDHGRYQARGSSRERAEAPTSAASRRRRRRALCYQRMRKRMRLEKR